MMPDRTVVGERLKKLRGSKYVQADAKFIYKEVRSLLKSGRKILFSGTPCQVAALYAVLGNAATSVNLFTVDIVCHGTPSVKVFEKYIKELHFLLKSGTSDSRLDWFSVGEYKRLPNEVGGIDTTDPESVAKEMRALINAYNGKSDKSFEDILAFHVAFERIHPFQDGNGRIGRLIAFKQCLKNNFIPFYIDDANKWLYYRGLHEWEEEKNYLIETCRFGQDQYKMILDYFDIK